MAPSPSAALGPVYCMIDGKKIEITGSKNINLEPETTYEYCIVRDTGECYTSYKAFIKKHCSHRLSDWKENQPPLKDRLYKIITKAPHESEKDVTVYIIEDMDTKQIYLIGEDGIVKYNKRDGIVGLSDAIITVDEPIITTTNERVTVGKGESEMRNEVLDLYEKRERERIGKQFEAMKEEEYNNLEAVKRYNELINTFKASVAELVDEYKNAEEKVFIKTVYEDRFGYEINPFLEKQIIEKFREDYEKEIKELERKVEEIRAVLSLSNDVEYQKGVLIEYGILNKKGVMVNE